MTRDPPKEPVRLAAETDFRIGPLTVCPSSRCVRSEHEQQKVLEPRVMQALVFLSKKPQEVVSRDELCAGVWGGAVVGDDAINTCIAKVRRVGETYKAYAIETVPRVGYRFVPASPVPDQAGDTNFIERRGRTATNRGLIAALVFGIVSLTLSLTEWNSVESPVTPTFAVLPFQALSVDQETRAFTANLHEEIAASLSNIRLEHTGPVTDPLQGPRSPPDFTISGSVERDIDQLRVRVNIHKREELLWSSLLVHPVDQTVSLRMEIAERLATTGDSITIALLASRQPVDLATLQLFVEGADQTNFGNALRAGYAVNLLKQVTEREPELAPAHSLLALAYLKSARIMTSEQDIAAAHEKARLEARIAYELLPERPEVYVGLATAAPLREWRQKQEYFLQALALPEAFQGLTYHYGRFLAETGRLSEGNRFQLSAIGEHSVEPWLTGMSLYTAGDYNRAVSWLDAGLLKRPRDYRMRFMRLYVTALDGDPEEALEILNDPQGRPDKSESEGMVFNDDQIEIFQAFLQARISGTPQDRQRAIQLLKNRFDSRIYQYPYIGFLAKLGDIDGEFASIMNYYTRPGVGLNSDYFTAISLYAPVLEPLRRDPRFGAIAEHLGLLEYWRATEQWPDFCANEPESVCVQMQALASE